MDIESRISTVRERLITHDIYGSINTIDELRIFMSAHIFAVWDFMTLAKRLQNSLTCTTLPWIAPGNSSAARLINEIIFFEETDLDHHGQPSSHTDMYLNAMREVGANTGMFDRFINLLNEGYDLGVALNAADVPEHIADFVVGNINCAMQGELEEVAGNFLFGREDAIPDMFTLFLNKTGVAHESIPAMVYYLKRHIELDGEEHGPAARKILIDLIGGDQVKLNNAVRAAKSAIESRIRLWDGILHSIRENR